MEALKGFRPVGTGRHPERKVIPQARLHAARFKSLSNHTAVCKRKLPTSLSVPRPDDAVAEISLIRAILIKMELDE